MSSPSTSTEPICSPAVTLDTTFAELYGGGDAAPGLAQPVLRDMLSSAEVDLSRGVLRGRVCAVDIIAVQC